MIRDKNTDRADFIFYSNRIIRLLVEEGLNHLPVVAYTVTSPVGKDYPGVKFQGKICGVSIMRAGESMEQGLRDCCRSVRIGKILIQRDEDTCQPKLFYEKLPIDIADRWVLLLDPMFATGGSAVMAINVLKAKGVPEDRILFLNIIASPEGVGNFSKQFPKVRVVTSFIDQGLNEKKSVLESVLKIPLIASTAILCLDSAISEIAFIRCSKIHGICRREPARQLCRSLRNPTATPSPCHLPSVNLLEAEDAFLRCALHHATLPLSPPIHLEIIIVYEPIIAITRNPLPPIISSPICTESPILRRRLLTRSSHLLLRVFLRHRLTSINPLRVDINRRIQL
jgi:uracil phosphoribosyltransferase